MSFFKWEKQNPHIGKNPPPTAAEQLENPGRSEGWIADNEYLPGGVVLDLRAGVVSGSSFAKQMEAAYRVAVQSVDRQHLRAGTAITPRRIPWTFTNTSSTGFIANTLSQSRNGMDTLMTNKKRKIESVAADIGRVAQSCAIALQAQVPSILWGSPGSGKTSWVRSMAKVLSLHCEVVIASIRDPTDFLGLPVVIDGETHYAAPAWAKRVARLGRSLVLFDDISTSPPIIQAALLRVILEGQVGDILLSNATFIAAANPPEEAAGGWELSYPLANRFVHFFWMPDATSWIDGFISQKWEDTALVPSLDENWREYLPWARALVGSFIRHRPELLLKLPPSQDNHNWAFPTPRSWDMASTLLAAAKSIEMAVELCDLLVGGAVGQGPWIEFFGWFQEQDLPDPEDLLASPKTFTLPDRGDKAYAVLSSVVAAVLGKFTEDRWRAGWQVLARAADAGVPDIAASAARQLGRATQKGFAVPVKELQKFEPLLAEVE